LVSTADYLAHDSTSGHQVRGMKLIYGYWVVSIGWLSVDWF